MAQSVSKTDAIQQQTGTVELEDSEDSDVSSPAISEGEEETDSDTQLRNTSIPIEAQK